MKFAWKRLLPALVVAVGCSGLATAQTSAPEGFEWGYNKGFYFRNPQFELKISTRTQFRYSYRMLESDAADRDAGFFSIPRARLRFDGYAWHPWLKYKIQYDFVGAKDQCDGANCDKLLVRSDLRDLYFDITRNPWYSVRIGQFKQPFGLQELTSSGDQEFVDRSIASLAFAPSREIGTMLWGTSFERVFGYEVAVSNGNGRNKTADINTGYRWTARVHWDPNGEYKLSEAAIGHPDKVNYTLGVAAMINSVEKDLLETTEPLRQDSAEAFFALKYKRLFVLADYYLRTEEQAAGASKIDSNGYVTQVGMFVSQKIEVALRYSPIARELDGVTARGIEKRIAFNWYFSGHDLKFQADYGRTSFDDVKAITDATGATSGDVDVFRAQLQIVF